MDLMRIPFVLEELRALSAETEWVEFKVNNTNPEEIGEYLSALSNTAAHTKVVLFAPRPLEKMEKSERVRACYQHACLKWLAGDWMSNESLRGRLDIPKTNYPPWLPRSSASPSKPGC